MAKIKISSLELAFFISLIIIFLPLISGIEKLSGTPEIIECSENMVGTVGEDETLRSSFTIKNIGSQTGEFFISTECGSTLTPFSESKITLQPQESETNSISINPGSGEEGSIKSGDCSITVTDRNSGKEDSCSFNVKATFPKDTEEEAILSKGDETNEQPKPNYWSYLIIPLVLILITLWVILNKK